MYVVMGLPRGPMGRRCVWLCVFASEEIKNKMVREEFKTGGLVVL
jgi:hypothetical protein